MNVLYPHYTQTYAQRQKATFKWISLRVSYARRPLVQGTALAFARLVRVARIELASTDWQPVVLPLNHTRSQAT